MASRDFREIFNFISWLTWGNDVNGRGNTSAIAEVDIINFVDDVSKEFDNKMEGYHDQD